MTPKTIALYLVGHGNAIHAVARQPRAVWIALLFVLSAGFAREYDGEDLLSEPWHLLLPLGASFITATILYALMTFVRPRSDGETLADYRGFLTLYWMTAPLAWLYAVPVERFLSAPDAVRANLWFLGIVSVWRVALITRVISVRYRVPPGRAFAVVMLFADTVALTVLYLTPLPIVSIMGGIRLTESEHLVQNTAFLIGFLGVVTWPIWLVATLVSIVRAQRSSGDSVTPDAEPTSSPPIAKSLWALAIASFVVWFAVLPATQPEQRRRRHVEQMLLNGRIEEAVRYLSARERTDFPPHWDPPPRMGYGKRTPVPLDVVETIIEEDAAPWVRSIYLEKLQADVDGAFGFGHNLGLRWPGDDPENLERHVQIFELVPEGPDLVEKNKSLLRATLDYRDYGLSDEFRVRLRRLLGLPDDEPEESDVSEDRSDAAPEE